MQKYVIFGHLLEFVYSNAYLRNLFMGRTMGFAIA